MFVTDFGDTKVYQLKTKGDAHMVLSLYFKDNSVITSLYMGNPKQLDVSKKCKQVLAKECDIMEICTKPQTPQQNDAEQEIKIIKIKTLQIIRAANVPAQLLDFSMIHDAEII